VYSAASRGPKVPAGRVTALVLWHTRQHVDRRDERDAHPASTFHGQVSRPTVQDPSGVDHRQLDDRLHRRDTNPGARHVPALAQGHGLSPDPAVARRAGPRREHRRNGVRGSGGAPPSWHRARAPRRGGARVGGAHVGEALHFPGNMAFYYQEFPKTLRSTATAMAPQLIALGFYLSTVFVDVVRRVTPWLPGNINNGRLDNVYWAVATVTTVNFGYFLVWVSLYKTRK
jgi:hypothetical protein